MVNTGKHLIVTGAHFKKVDYIAEIKGIEPDETLSRIINNAYLKQKRRQTKSKMLKGVWIFKRFK